MGVWLPPEQYVNTIARPTTFGCLFFTDAEGNPFQIRSVEGTNRWDWPGGNMDHGETPLECATRECREEIGFVPDRGFPLLGMHFIRPRRTAWPCPHIGFIFDGGILTAGDLGRIVLSEEHSHWEVKTAEEWEMEMTAESFRELAAVLEARRSGVVQYIES